jgi:serine/threonine protein kinase
MGLVLYETLSGDIPFKASNPLTLALKRLNHAPEALSVRKPELPTALCDVVMKALQLSPSDRFGSAREMAEALEALPR